MKHKIAVIPGDGIGKEVVDEGIKALKACAEIVDELEFEFSYFPWGSEYYLKNGVMLPENGLEILKEFDAIYLGAIGDPRIPDHISLRELLLKIRFGFDQYVNLRPVKRWASDLDCTQSVSKSCKTDGLANITDS